MAGFHLRFRKSFTLIPGVLHWTVSKRGVSLNLHLGIYSKSWGTGGRRTSTIDVPGTSGLFFRKQQRVKHDPEDADEGFGHLLQLVLIWGGALVGIARYELGAAGAHCITSGSPLVTLAAMLAGELVVFVLLWRSWGHFRGFLGVFVALLASYLQWKIYGHLIAPDITCS